jgi:hypothetical protein
MGTTPIPMKPNIMMATVRTSTTVLTVTMSTHVIMVIMNTIAGASVKLMKNCRPILIQFMMMCLTRKRSTGSRFYD